MKTTVRLRSAYRELRFVLKGLFSTDHPILAHVIPMRRCNLACSYCNEYDKDSDPVPNELMNRRIGKLAELGTSAIIFSGGEPLLHPGIEELISSVRRQGIMAALISNCYLLTREKIHRLNDSGLEYLQISIDNVVPDEVSKKSLKVLDKKLTWLSELAQFKVNINSVIGGGVRSPEDALIIAKRAMELGFSSTAGVMHDGWGTLKPLSEKERTIYSRLRQMTKKSYARVNYFQDSLVAGEPSNWRCRAGARYLYICENGLVHYCSQQRGYPGVPLEGYTVEDIRREYLTKKACATYCTVSCVHQVATFDFWRDPQTLGTEGVRSPAQNQPVPDLHQIK